MQQIWAKYSKNNEATQLPEISRQQVQKQTPQFLLTTPPPPPSTPEIFFL